MFEKIYDKIKENNTIVIARHIGVDPDALGAQFALKLSISKTFTDKKVYALGSKSSKYNYFPKLDKFEKIENEKVLLIVVDTPDKKRVDISNLELYDEICKIDHHPFIERFGEYEHIDTTASSASELVLQFLKANFMKIDTEIAEYLFMGIVSDTNRFLFNTTDRTFEIARDLVKNYNLDVSKLYQNLYLRPISEVRFQGYISENMKVTEHGLGYVIITNDIMNKYGVDASSAGNMINNFNNIEEVIVWVTISEDIKNNVIKLSIRSRGPVINGVAEKYNGGGHKFASGARVSSLNEAEMLLDDLDDICKNYIEGEQMYEN